MEELKWWQKAVFYQIYPRSFADGNGDGIGDFYGMIDRLDYLQELGIDALWLSPHYPSPQHDCGYDIADYTGVEPEYGTLDDFKRFLDGAHQRGIRVILDLVLSPAPAATTPNGTGTSGSMGWTAIRPTTGTPALAARPGNMTQPQANTTITTL